MWPTKSKGIATVTCSAVRGKVVSVGAIGHRVSAARSGPVPTVSGRCLVVFARSDCFRNTLDESSAPLVKENI